MPTLKIQRFFMASSKNSSKKSSEAIGSAFGIIFPFSDFFYILQQEEYDSGRYLYLLPHFFFRRNFQERDHLKYTKRVASSTVVAAVLWFGTGVFALSRLSSAGFFTQVLLPVIWLLLIPIFVLITNWLLMPYYDFVKRRVMRRAARKVREHKDLKIVAVAGSFGKTTTKNFIYDLVRYNYVTQIIPGNINTPLGIGMWVFGSLQKNTRLLIVEVDAYKRGEIASSIKVVPPDIAIVTNVGDQHLMRFGSKENLAAALKETFLGAKPGAQLLCTDETAAMFGSLGHDREMKVITNEEPLGFLNDEILGRFSASNRINLAFAVSVAELLAIPRAFIIDSCGKLELPDRRQKTIVWHGYQCIDDSYNISLTTALAGLDAAQAMARREQKKLLVVTAGIPEFGPDNKDDNARLGSAIAKNADHTVVLKSIFADEIIKGIGRDNKYSIAKNFQSFIEGAHAAFPPGDWVLLLQPELTDLYY
jgi:UDP-N-acetylmuramoyl-tripeptide--D-alanyl-D-alanine ligase